MQAAHANQLLLAVVTEVKAVQSPAIWYRYSTVYGGGIDTEPDCDPPSTKTLYQPSNHQDPAINAPPTMWSIMMVEEARYS